MAVCGARLTRPAVVVVVVVVVVEPKAAPSPVGRTAAPGGHSAGTVPQRGRQDPCVGRKEGKGSGGLVVGGDHRAGWSWDAMVNYSRCPYAKQMQKVKLHIEMSVIFLMPCDQKDKLYKLSS
jgi:hypothetical protein